MGQDDARMIAWKGAFGDHGFGPAFSKWQDDARMTREKNPQLTTLHIECIESPTIDLPENLNK